MTGKVLTQSAIALGIGLALGVAGSYRGETIGGMRILLLLVIVAFAAQWLAFVPSYLKRTEHYYDLVGSLTYQSLAVLGFILTDTRDARTVVLVGMILIWAIRLGTFLFRRVKRAGSDGRFDKIKHNWARFLMAWTVQGLWVTFTAGAALAAVTSGDKSGIGPIGIVGIVIWAIGFGIEIRADQEKATFRANPANAGRFITGGLWSWSRHPNYFGEFFLWLGVAILAAPALQGWQFVTLLSPVFVYLLLTKVSGVPLLEKRSDDKWGGEPDYEAYKSNTPVFFPRPPG